jgi:hypothetical protein
MVKLSQALGKTSKLSHETKVFSLIIAHHNKHDEIKLF